MKKNDLLEEGFCVWKWQEFDFNHECNPEESRSIKEEIQKFPIGSCVKNRGKGSTKLTTCDSTFVSFTTYKTDDCSGEPEKN